MQLSNLTAENRDCKAAHYSGCLLLLNSVIIFQVLMVNELQKQFSVLEIVDHGLSHRNGIYIRVQSIVCGCMR